MRVGVTYVIGELDEDNGIGGSRRADEKRRHVGRERLLLTGHVDVGRARPAGAVVLDPDVSHESVSIAAPTARNVLNSGKEGGDAPRAFGGLERLLESDKPLGSQPCEHSKREPPPFRA